MTIEEIKKYMKENGIKQYQLAEKAHIPLGTIRDIFRGKTKAPRIDTMRAIEEALGLNKKATEEPPHNRQNFIKNIESMTEEEFARVAPLMEQIVKTFDKK